MYTANAIFVSVSENIGQDCLSFVLNSFAKKVISLEKINISRILLLIHEVIFFESQWLQIVAFLICVIVDLACEMSLGKHFIIAIK